MQLGPRLRQLREARGWTLSDVSTMTGVSVSHLSAIEKGTRPTPSFAVIVKLAKAYEVSILTFVDSEDRPSQLASTTAEAPEAYLAIVQGLIESQALDNPPELLERIAQYLRHHHLKDRESD